MTTRARPAMVDLLNITDTAVRRAASQRQDRASRLEAPNDFQ
jgi:hypothetical protein